MLEAANVRLASVASDPLGKTGRAIIESLLAGDKTPEQIARTVPHKLRASQQDIARAIDGVLTDTTRFLVRQMLGHIDQVAVAVAEIDARIAQLLEPMREPCALLTGVPGINSVSAAGVLAEIGADMSVFPSSDHLVSWLDRVVCGCAAKHEFAHGANGDLGIAKAVWGSMLHGLGPFFGRFGSRPRCSNTRGHFHWTGAFPSNAARVIRLVAWTHTRASTAVQRRPRHDVLCRAP